VTRLEDVQALWDAAVKRFGRVDVWINNAGLAHSAIPIRELDPVLAKAVIETNITGSIYGSQVALRGMIAQGGGQIFNMEGYGSRGEVRTRPPLSVYGTSKYAVRYLSRALALEAAGTPVLVGTLSPGMLATELVTEQYADRPEEWERAKRILNVFVERVETVAPWLADRVLANTRNGVAIRWLTPFKLAGYFLLAPFRKRDVFGPAE
jgi:NAD(P)-dependent dehydrogenase (short-subunit alcohol dehydrogenase family)